MNELDEKYRLLASDPNDPDSDAGEEDDDEGDSDAGEEDNDGE